jgi:hypothetical protein
MVEFPTGATLLAGRLYVSEARWKPAPAVRARNPQARNGWG